MASTLATKMKTKLKDVKDLGQQLLSSRAHINNLPLFLTFISPSLPSQFNTSIYQKLLHSIINFETLAEFLSDLLASKYLKYIDVRYFTYINMQKLAKTLESKDIYDTNTICRDDNDECYSRESTKLCIYHMHCIMLQIPLLEGLDENAQLEM
ncbi:hypothetical protein SLE2022_376480 [Rubroshorea leprosula]